MWTSTLAGKYVPVDAWALCFSAFRLTIAPVVLGVLIRWKLPRLADAIGGCGPTFAVAAFTLHVLGFGFGYAVSKALRYPESVARTVSIEVGMQNGGMAASLAREHFAAMPLAAAAGVFSGVVQNIIGGLVAAWWKRR
jgi:BASS family bile acid:Na+ symporter